jgi:hypothetical protein
MVFYSSFVRNEYNEGRICNLIMLGYFRSILNFWNLIFISLFVTNFGTFLCLRRASIVSKYFLLFQLMHNIIKS